MTEPYSSVDDVQAWNMKAGNVCPDKPVTQLAENRKKHNDTFLRHRRILAEEMEEWDDADSKGDAVGIFDALCDMQVVLDGIFAAYGMAHLKEAGVREVMLANWSKFDSEGNPIKRADGKILKGPHYTPPNLAPILEGKTNE